MHQYSSSSSSNINQISVEFSHSTKDLGSICVSIGPWSSLGALKSATINHLWKDVPFGWCKSSAVASALELADAGAWWYELLGQTSHVLRWKSSITIGKRWAGGSANRRPRPSSECPSSGGVRKKVASPSSLIWWRSWGNGNKTKKWGEEGGRRD